MTDPLARLLSSLPQDLTGIAEVRLDREPTGAVLRLGSAELAGDGTSRFRATVRIARGIAIVTRTAWRGRAVRTDTIQATPEALGQAMARAVAWVSGGSETTKGG